MLAKPLLNQILCDEAVTRGLADPEARMLVEWLAERADQVPETAASTNTLPEPLQRLCRRCRAIARFVCLWCHRRERGAAGQLAAAEHFTWPLPAARVDPCELMQSILNWEDASEMTSRDR